MATQRTDAMVSLWVTPHSASKPVESSRKMRESERVSHLALAAMSLLSRAARIPNSSTLASSLF